MENKKIGRFPLTYWVAIMFEFFERGSYYGMMSFFAVYLTDTLYFSKEGVSLITGTVVPFLIYGLPLITGAVADKLGYRRCLIFAFSFLGTGYFLLSSFDTYTAVFLSMMVIGIGAGIFKPIISGTIAKVTDEKTSTIGFGIFYWTINLGAFLFPLIIVPYLKTIDVQLIFVVASILTGSMIIPTLLFYKEIKTNVEATKTNIKESIAEIYSKIKVVFLDGKFILFIFIYSMFWIIYFQMYGSVLWYMNDFIDASVFNNFVNNAFGIEWFKSSFGFSFKFDVEHVTVINAGTIIILQLFISKITAKTKALPTMICGMAFGTLGIAILAISSDFTVFIIGLTVFSLGEMTAHPKYFSYLGFIAPPDKKATYMGFGFLYGVFGSFIGNLLGGFLYVRCIDKPVINYLTSKLGNMDLFADVKKHNLSGIIEVAEKNGIARADILNVTGETQMWLIYTFIGIIGIVGLFLYDKYVLKRK